MDAEHKRPLAAFVVVSVTSALLLGQSVYSEPDAVDTARPAASRASHATSTSPASSADPANGHVVEGVTASPTYLPVKPVGRAPVLVARGDSGLGVSTGAIGDPGSTEPSTTEAPTAGPQGAEPSATAEPTPSAEPGDDDAQPDGNDDTPGPRSTPPSGPWSTGTPPTSGPGAHTPSPTAEPSD